MMRVFKIGFTVFVLALLLWLFGFGYFALRTTSMTVYDPQQPAGAIVVLTGGNSRIDEGLNLFAARRGLYLFVTSVHPDIIEEKMRARWGGKTPLPICCINLDYTADSTVGNANATRDWIEQIYEASGQRIDTIRLVTSDYHMVRALQDFRFIVPGVEVYPHPVSSEGKSKRGERFWKLLIEEYHKSIFRGVFGNLLNLVKTNSAKRA